MPCNVPYSTLLHFHVHFHGCLTTFGAPVHCIFSRCAGPECVHPNCQPELPQTQATKPHITVASARTKAWKIASSI